MSINWFTPPPFKLPRLLLLDTEPHTGAGISLALGQYSMPYAFAELYRAAVAGLLGESPSGVLRPPGADKYVMLGDKTYLRHNIEVAVQTGMHDFFGPEFDATAMLMWHRIRFDMPSFACSIIEDATQDNARHVIALCEHILATDNLAPREIYWLSVSDDPADAMSKFPDWAIDAGIRFSAQQSASFTSPDEILSALEKLT